MNATWYIQDLDRQEWSLRPYRLGELLATVIIVQDAYLDRAPARVMWTTYGQNNAMGYCATLGDAKAAAITALAIRALEQS